MPQFLPGRSYLYNGEITKEVLSSNQVGLVDLITAEMGDVGVKELRKIITQASERPYGTNRLLWLRNVVSPTDIIQDTLLKILEEPGDSLIIIVQTQNVEELLPTVRSRLHIVRSEDRNEMIESVLPANLPAIDTYLRGIKDRAELVAAFVAELSATRCKFLELPSAQTSSQIQQLVNAISRLKQNCNQKMVIDAFLLHWNHSSGKA